MGSTPLTIVVNAAAGARSHAEAVRRAFPEANVVEVDDPAKVRSALKAAADRGDVMGVSGGDGTVNAAVSVALCHGTKLLVVPGGTLNHFARAVGIDSIDDAMAAVHGPVLTVDVSRIADRDFVNTASLGAYPELVATRERHQGRIGKWPALALALVRVLRRCGPTELEIDGVHRRVWLVFVGNCEYEPQGFAPSRRDRLDDGMLDVRVVDAGSPWSRSRLALAILTGTLVRSPLYEQRTARRLEIRSLDGPLPLAVDGEVFDGPAEFTVEKVEASLQVLVPP